MKLEKLLSQHKTALIKRWFDEVVRTYPVGTAKFLKQQKDPFANPVGRTTLNGLEALFDVLTTGMDREAINSFWIPLSAFARFRTLPLHRPPPSFCSSSRSSGKPSAKNFRIRR